MKQYLNSEEQAKAHLFLQKHAFSENVIYSFLQ